MLTSVISGSPAPVCIGGRAQAGTPSLVDGGGRVYGQTNLLLAAGRRVSVVSVEQA